MDPYLLLAVAEGCGPGLVPALLDPQREPAALLAGHGLQTLPRAARRRLRDPELPHEAARWRDEALRQGQVLLTPTDPRYPPRLRQRPLRPNVLFAQGALDVLALAWPAVAVVGSRTPTGYGISACEEFTAALGRAGFAVWSGLARGIDAVAHRTALRVGAPTVAVLAGGLDVVYPTEHRDLAGRIRAGGGAMLSESPPGRRALRGHFPRRNRILTATDAVLVVEASRSSGTLHTARFAADAGVDVFAVPGPYGSPRSAGCHDLIADGAQIAAHPADLLRRLGVDASLRGRAGAAGGEVDAAAAAILAVLDHGPRPTDLVQRESGLDEGAFLLALQQLRGRGLVREMAGDLLRRATP